MRYNNIPEFNKILGIYPGEVFKDITEYHISGVYPYYSISNYGRVYHKAIGKLLELGIDRNGYITYPFSTANGTINRRIHRLEMIVFCPIIGYENLDVNHKDGVKTHNWLWNLEWATRSENIIHAFNSGLMARGEDSSSATITEEQAIEICKLLESGKNALEISSILNIPRTIIQHIKNGDSWKHISKDYIFSKKPHRLFTEDQIRLICEFFQNNPIGGKQVNTHSKDALIYAGLEASDNNIDTVRKIYTRKYYINISSDYIF